MSEIFETIQIMRKNLGPVTAYKYAVSQGYTGTEQEFAALMASYATVAQEAESAKNDAVIAQQAAEAAQVAAEAAASQAEGISVDDLYYGYQKRNLTWENGWINSSGVYDSTSDKFVSNVLPTIENKKVTNNSSGTVYIVYFREFTSFSDYTYGLYVTVNAGASVNLSTNYPYFLVQSPATTRDELHGVKVESNAGYSDLNYLSHDNIQNTFSNFESAIENRISNDEMYYGNRITVPTFTNGYINSSGVYTSNTNRLISNIFETDKYKKVVNESGKSIYVTYFSAFTDFSDYVYGTYVTIIAGSELSLPAQYPYFAIQGSNNAVTLNDLKGVAVIGDSDYSYLSYNHLRFASSEQFRFVESAKRTFTESLADNVADNPLPVFVHITDVHGDGIRFKHAVEIAEKISANAIIDTGDVVRFNSTDPIGFIDDALENSNIVYLPTIGNHDSYTLTEQGIYEKFIDPFATGLVFDPNVTYPTYYYKDFTNQKLRIIAVNQFQYRGVSNNSTQRNYHQEQINFLCDALINTPDGYGIIVLIHTPEAYPVKANDYPKFYQEEALYFNSGASIKPIYEIVDAYISGTELTKTYDNISGNTPETFTVNADFSEKHNSEFICYMSGHTHFDSVCYVTGVTNKQLMLNSVCTNAWTHLNTSGSPGSSYPYYCELSDLPRVIGTETEDAVNVYAIDRINKSVRIVRIGSDMPYDFAERRDYMVIPYTD